MEQTTAVETIRVTVKGLGGMDPSDFSIPRVSLLQPTSKESEAGKLAGKYHNSVTGATMDALEVVVISAKKQRVLFAEGGGGVLCASDDAEMPRPGMPLPFGCGPTCAQCVKSQWAKGSSGKNTPPPCSATVTYMCVDFVTNSPFLFTMSRSATSVARKLNTVLAQNGMQNVIRFTSHVERGPMGSYYVPDFEVTDTPVPLEAQIKLAEMAEALDIGKSSGRTNPAEADSDTLPF